MDGAHGVTGYVFGIIATAVDGCGAVGMRAVWCTLLEETKYHRASERPDKGSHTVSTRTNTSSRD